MAEYAAARPLRRLGLPLFRFCPRCGIRDDHGDDGRRYACSTCGFVYFHNTATGAAALVICDDRLLTTRRAHAPAAGMLDLPGGFVDPGETAEAALARELAEELGWRALPAAPRYLCSQPNRYLYAGVEYATCDVFFLLDVRGPCPAIERSVEIAEHRWVELAALDPGAFGFASVRAALGYFAQAQRR